MVNKEKNISKIGKPIFAMAKYEKVYRVTLPINGAELILTSIELEGNVMEIIEKILKIQRSNVEN